MSRSDIEAVMKGCEFFKDLDASYIQKISGLCARDDYAAGDHVFRQGDYGEHIYILAGGKVALERSVNLLSRKGSVIIEVLGRGRMFGCWSTLLGEPHILLSTATCQEPSRVVRLKGAELRQMMMDDARIGCPILERLCFVLRDRIQAAYGALEKI